MIISIAKALNRKSRDNKGFTLVELMAVLAVLAIIAAIAVPRFNATIEVAREKADKATAQMVARAAEQKWMDDDEDSAEDYTGTQLASAEYLREAPEPQNTSSYDDFKAIVDSDGICDEVVYTDGSDDGSDNLLDD